MPIPQEVVHDVYQFYFLGGVAALAVAANSSGLSGINACNWKDVVIAAGPTLGSTLPD